MNEKQINDIVNSVKAGATVETLLYSLIDIARENGQQHIDVQDIRTIVDEL